MDTNKKYILPRTIVLAACSLLLAGACDNNAYDGIGTDTPAKEVPLNFNASIEKTEVEQTRAITTPTTDFDGTSYTFGMSIKSDNGNEIVTGSSDMTALMERTDASAPWNWSFTSNAGNLPVVPMSQEGKTLKVIAYYPRIPSDPDNACTNGIPFDFTSTTDLKQTDLLYNTNTTYIVPSTDQSKVDIPLQFRHAYTWIVLNIRKYVSSGPSCTLESVILDNLTDAGWVKNQGLINPETGLVKDGANSGPIGVTLNPGVELSATEDQTYEFLVPSFMDPKVQNNELILVFKVNGINELFILNREYLNQISDDSGQKSFGFRQGYKNTYNLIYNNSSLSMNIQNWTSEVISGGFGADITYPGNFIKVYLRDSKYYWANATIPGVGYKPYPPKSTYLTVGEHLYANYVTTVAYGGNGAYVPVNTPLSSSLPTGNVLGITDDINVYTNENVYPNLMVTNQNISTVPVPWEDENGELVAKGLCRNYRGGGKTGWRLPRASELRTILVLVSYNTNEPPLQEQLGFHLNTNRYRPYWTSTEVDENRAWSMYYYNDALGYKEAGPVLSAENKSMKLSVRCVRDMEPGE